ncbi:MAG TPA: class I SAM-dependent methyltransferase [Solirubrobacteraceae bacterium]|jgi:ubiquinone/menaquinone biosynthesis C-methylase UbiE
MSSIAWHNGQYVEPNRSTVRMREFVSRVLAEDEQPGEVLEGGCGAGAKMLQLSDLFPQARWTGVDLDEEPVRAGQERLDPQRFTLLQGNLHELEQTFGTQRFDISFSIMTLSWMEDYEHVVEQMLAVTRKWLFIFSLFSDTQVDAFIRIVGRMPGTQEGLRSFYNVYSLPRFLRFCHKLGATEAVTEPFEIDLDLPRPDHGGMGTWTVGTADGRRLQFSGPLSMPWWFVAVRAPVGGS